MSEAKRVQTVRLSQEELAALLLGQARITNLPPDARVIGMIAHPFSFSFGVIALVESESFQPVPMGGTPPAINPEVEPISRPKEGEALNQETKIVHEAGDITDGHQHCARCAEPLDVSPFPPLPVGKLVTMTEKGRTPHGLMPPAPYVMCEPIGE